MKRLVATLFILLISLPLYSQNNQAVVYNRKVPEIGWRNDIILFPNGQFISVMKLGLAGGYTYGHWKQYDNILELNGYPRVDYPVDINATTKYNHEIGERTAIYLEKEYPIVAEYNGRKMRFFPFKGARHGEFLPFRAEKIWVECGILPHNEQKIKEIELYDSINNRYDNVIIIDIDETHTVQRNPYQKYIILDNCTIYELSSDTKYTRRDSVSAERFLKEVITENILNTIDEHCKENSSIMNPVAYDTCTAVPNMTRFMIKYEENRNSIDHTAITKKVAQLLTKQQTLTCENEYILLINYLNGECHEADISRMMYNIFLQHPDKANLLNRYICFLPTEELEPTRQKFAMLLAHEHSKRVTTFKKEEFETRFPVMQEYIRYITPEITRQNKCTAKMSDTGRIYEIYDKIEKEIENNELATSVREIIKNIQANNTPTLTENEYAMIILYWTRDMTEYADEIGARLYDTIFLYPYLAEYINMILTDNSFKKLEVAKKNFARSIAIEHSKRQALFHEDIFYQKFPVMKLYKKYIDPVIEEADKKYLDDLRKLFGN